MCLCAHVHFASVSSKATACLCCFWASYIVTCRHSYSYHLKVSTRHRSLLSCLSSSSCLFRVLFLSACLPLFHSPLPNEPLALTLLGVACLLFGMPWQCPPKGTHFTFFFPFNPFSQHICGGQRKTSRSLCPPCGCQRSSSGHQVWQQAPLPTEPSHWPIT